VIGRGKRGDVAAVPDGTAAEPPTVSINLIVDELVRSHHWPATEFTSEYVTGQARAAGHEIPDNWSPTLPAEAARKLLAELVATREADERRHLDEDVAARFEHDEWMRDPYLRPAELTRFFGTRLAEAAMRGDGPLVYGEAYGPADPPAKGGLREEGLMKARAMDRLRGGLLDDSVLDTVAMASDDDGW
jgi:hypothetical protein